MVEAANRTVNEKAEGRTFMDDLVDDLEGLSTM